MNVYDFDNTIYRGDCTVDFVRWCIGRHPAALGALARSGGAFLRWRAGRGTLTEAKERLFSFLPRLDAEAEAERFWRARSRNIKVWYMGQRRPDDIIISASPEFLLAPICRELGVTLMASMVDPATGRFREPNCKGAEKVRRLRERFPEAVVDDFYSDSLSDTPLAELAKRAFIVKGDNRTPWPGKKY